MSWVKLECPRCRAVSSVPASQKGQYVACPGCRMKVMVSYQAPAAEAPASAGAATGAAAPNPAMPPSASQHVPATAGAVKGSSSASAGATPPGNQSPRVQQPYIQQPYIQQPQIQQPQNRQPQFNPTPPAGQGAQAARPGAPPAPAGARVDDLANPFGEAPILPPPAAGPSPIYGGAAPVYGGPMYAAPNSGQAVTPRGPAAPPVAAASGSMMSVPGPPAPPAPYPVAVPSAAISAAAETFGMSGQRKVARFIAADTAQSTLQLAPDGQLPTLTLVDNLKATKETNEGSSINPLVLVITIAFSLVLCVVLLFSDVGGEGSVDSAGDRIRHDLELYYKGQKEPLAAYQTHLRQAQQAHSRGDTKTAQNHYRKVLDMLRAEGGSRFRGVTGTPKSDKDLEEKLSRLLGQDYTPEPMEENQRFAPMDPTNRYELVAEIARGDFAVVYRARDRELGREVAIKQIHQQYLSDTRTLDRFWREAQLLASLEHRSIMTIYDMVRSRGWLVLELMPASLQKYAQGEPLDLDLLRVTLSCSLQALEYLHANKIIHGDIKPSNLFLDKRSWVKVGDFGLARRVSNEQGSLVKGTTRYMAPELVSQQFGPVGPASDLYSLGFSAYELMCGKEFDSLFPGLDAFGRDKQIAWMMWHAAPDRRLPPIDRVLAGVPDDLRTVIQRLTTKNPNERYRRAGEALADLKSRLQLVNADGVPDEESEEAQAAKARRNRRKKILFATLGFFVSSAIVLTLAIFNPPEKPSGPPPLPPDIHGVVRTMLKDKNTIVIEDSATQAPREMVVHEHDQMFLNGVPSVLLDIQERDQLVIKTPARDKRGRDIHDYYATRADRSAGVVSAVDPATGQITVDLSEPMGKSLKLAIPPDVGIRFNNHEQWQGKPLKVADLMPGDRVAMEHDGTDEVRRAISLDVARVVPLEGYLRRLDIAKHEATIALGRESDAKLETWPLSEECEVTLNGQKLLDGALMKPTDLKPGDEVTVQHDKQIMSIDAHRTLRQAGLVQSTRPEKHEFDIMPTGQDRAVTCTVATDTKIRLGGETVSLADLHRGDEVKVTYDSLDIANAEALTVDAVRQPDPERWAVVVGEQAFDDRAVSPLAYAAADARLVMQTLIGRFQVPQEQTLLMVDNPKALWEESLPSFVGRVPVRAQLLVYYVGHAYAEKTASEDKAIKVWLAPRDFTLSKPETTGMALSAFVDQFEKCAAREKLFLLDATHSGVGRDLRQEPAGEDMIQSLLLPGRLSPVRTLTAIASCKTGQRGQDSIEQRQGRFALALAAGLSGRADRNLDNHLEPVELFEFLTTALSGGPQTQTPVLFLPDDTPPRLAEEARKAIRKLYGNLLVPKFDAAGAQAEFDAAQELAGMEPEPRMIYGLLLLKTSKYKLETESLKIFDELKAGRPDDLLPVEAAAWLRFKKQDYNGGTVDLLQLLQKVAKLTSASPGEAKYALGLAGWVGRLREFAATVADANRRPPAALFEQVDAAAQQLPDDVRKSYEQGREHVKRIAGGVDREIAAAAGDNQAQLALEVKRKQLPNYVTFPTEAAGKKVLDGMVK